MSERMTDEQMYALVQILKDDAAEHKEFFPSDKSYQNMHREAIQAITQLRDERDTLTAQVKVLQEGFFIYGNHLDTCHEDTPCNCGFNEACAILAEAEAAKETGNE